MIAWILIAIAGEHPRMGALDVCPFIPVQNVSMEDCVECAKEFADKLSTELGVPGMLTLSQTSPGFYVSAVQVF